MPKANLVGEEGQGWTIGKRLLQHERTNISGGGRLASMMGRSLGDIAKKYGETDAAGELADKVLRDRIADFEISVACYPEVHPEAASPEADLDNLERKLDNGATRAITQFFYDIDAFLFFMEKLRKAGVNIPVSPGIMPVSNYKGLKKMAGPVGIPLPAWLGNLFEGLDGDPETRKLIAASVASEMCVRLAEEGYSDFHFYTLNRADLVYAICRVLGVRETPSEIAA